MIGIVILNYKSYDDTFKCVDSIRNTIDTLPYRIYIVDNLSPNDSYEKLLRQYSEDRDIVVVQSEKNGGFSYGNNIGFRLAIKDNCDTILCTNSDVDFYENAISIMKNTLDSDDLCAVVGPKVYCKDGSIQNCIKGKLTAACFILRRKPFSIFDWCSLEKKYTYADYKYDKPLIVDGMVSGCCFMCKANLLEEVGFLDDNVFMYHEEDILGAKLRAKGYNVILDPNAEIIHFGGGSTGSNTAFVRYHTFCSGLYYLRNYTHTSKFSFWIVSGIVKIMFFLRSIGSKTYKMYYKKIKLQIKDLRKSKRVTG